MNRPVFDVDALLEMFDCSVESGIAKLAGAPVANAELASQAENLRVQLEPLARIHRLNGEARGVATLDWKLLTGCEHVAQLLGAEVQAIHPEFQISGRWRVDRAVTHTDGSISLIEVKDCCSPREIAVGIGQVLFYKACLERTTSFGPIRPCLAALIDEDQDLERACSLAGVTFIPLGNLKWTRAISRLTDLVLNPLQFTERERG